MAMHVMHCASVHERVGGGRSSKHKRAMREAGDEAAASADGAVDMEADEGRGGGRRRRRQLELMAAAAAEPPMKKRIHRMQE
jgi:hypothetical protein